MWNCLYRSQINLWRGVWKHWCHRISNSLSCELQYAVEANRQKSNPAPMCLYIYKYLYKMFVHIKLFCPSRNWMWDKNYLKNFILSPSQHLVTFVADWSDSDCSWICLPITSRSSCHHSWKKNLLDDIPECHIFHISVMC